MIRTHHLAVITTLLALASPAAAKPKKSKLERPGPRTLIFDAKDPSAAPQVMITGTPASAVPTTSLFVITIAAEEDSKRSEVVVEEKDMILDQGKTAKP